MIRTVWLALLIGVVSGGIALAAMHSASTETRRVVVTTYVRACDTERQMTTCLVESAQTQARLNRDPFRFAGRCTGPTSGPFSCVLELTAPGVDACSRFRVVRTSSGVPLPQQPTPLSIAACHLKLGAA